jgi:predicted ATPase/class 3 adenylate cyclase
MSALPDGASANLPSGTVTFAFTDIEGSTPRWDRDRAAMEAAVRRHDALMREAIAAHNGYVFKTIGDAFCAAFARPEDAVGAMFDAQRALGAEDFSAVDGLRVRVAVHTGTADERDRDYFGPAGNRVARLLGIGHGGQVLLSGVTSELVRGALSPLLSLRDLGEHRLKDLSRPEHVYQLVGPALIGDFPPLRSLSAMPNNLPRQMTSFVGRETEVAEITALLAKHQLVTIVGSGGVGKTRTSLQVAANLLDGSGDGVWFIELAPLSSGDYIPSTVATVLGLTLPSKGDPLEHLVRATSAKHALLVFDNCEHLVEAAARVASALLRGCPRIAVLASSRQGFGIAGETTYRMPALAVPPRGAGGTLSASDAARYAAIALFVERAQAADRRFSLMDDTAPVVAEICRRLDGIPLAIELAAARVNILSPRQLRDKLDERFRVLTGGSRDVLPRQQTLRALIDWSYDLLDERERTFFCRLGIFVDGFTLEGASAIASVDDLDEFDVLDLVASLVEKSLVLAEPSGDALRYRLLESTRAYAFERLREARERDLIAGRHLRHLRDWFAEIFERQEATSQSAEKYAALIAELEGVRFALADALERQDIVAGAELLAAIERTWSVHSIANEGIAWNEAFIAALPADEVLLLAKLSAVCAALWMDNGMTVPSLESATKASAYARTSGDGSTLATALRWTASAKTALREYADADAALCEAETIPQLSSRMRRGLIEERTKWTLANGDIAAAARFFEDQLADHRALGNVRNVHAAILNLADVEFQRGDIARAISLVRDILPEVRSGSDLRIHAYLAGNLAEYLAASNELAGAAEASREAITTFVREPDNRVVTAALGVVALIDAVRGNFIRAARLLGYCEAAYAKDDVTLSYTERTTYNRLVSLLDANMSPEDRARLAVEGAALAPDAAAALAR